MSVTALAPAPKVPAPVTPSPPRTPEFRSPEIERLLNEQERLELDRRAQAELERHGAAAGKD